MKTITRYKCEKCGRTFETKQEALNCENHHAMPEKILPKSYTYEDMQFGYPCVLEIQMDNGDVCEYVYRNQIKKIKRKRMTKIDGYVIKYGTLDACGRKFMPGCCEASNGLTVPVINRLNGLDIDIHSLDNVIGHALLKTHEDGLYAHCEVDADILEDTLKEDPVKFSCYANKINQNNKREVSSMTVREIGICDEVVNCSSLNDSKIERYETYEVEDV